MAVSEKININCANAAHISQVLTKVKNQTDMHNPSYTKQSFTFSSDNHKCWTKFKFKPPDGSESLPASK